MVNTNITIVDLIFNIFMNENTVEKIVKYVDVSPPVRERLTFRPETLKLIQKLESETSLKKVIHGL